VEDSVLPSEDGAEWFVENTAAVFLFRGNTRLRLPACKVAMLLAAVALARCSSARSVDPSLDISQYAHTSSKVRDGFTQGLITRVAQGPNGYLWLGTEFGLVRFDGVRAVAWQPPPKTLRPARL
jgi:hypothetical protein